MSKIDVRGLTVLIVLTSIISLILVNNGIYLIVGLLVMLIIISLTWRQYIPNVFTFIMLFHAVQVLTYVLYINSSWEGNLLLFTNSSLKAYFSTLFGLVIMCFVFNNVAYKNIVISKATFEVALAKINPKKVLYLYLILYVLSATLSRIAFAFGGLTQVFLNIALLKWAGFVLLGYLSFKQKEYRIFFFIAFILDFIGGFFSFFSSFKDVFFYSAIVVMTYITTINFNISLKSITIAISLAFLAVIWTVVKSDYRQFLNQGTRQQVVTVSGDEAYKKLFDLLKTVDRKKFNEGIGQFFYRIQYVYHLSKAMDIVPEKEPFQGGAIWKETVEFVTLPRILNPNKGILNTSAKASKFTGIEFLGQAQGVSFSLGYFADCYIDFGLQGMFLALAVIAFLWSLIFRFLLFHTTNNIVINYSIIAAFFVQLSFFEMDGTFMFGRMFTTFVIFLLLKFTLFRRLEKFVTFNE